MPSCVAVAQRTLNQAQEFIESRRDGLSQNSISFYQGYLARASSVTGINTSCRDINHFLKSLTCSGGGKHAYYRCLRAYFNWLYSRKSGYKLNNQDNPILDVEAPKVDRKTLPSLNIDQLDYLIEQASCTRDKAIISLFADSGLRLAELSRIKTSDIDWENRLIKVKCKGNKEGLAPFGSRTAEFMRAYQEQREQQGQLFWDVNAWGISSMLQKLRLRTGLPCNPHTFRRTFASILAKREVDSLHIKRLGRWESVQMVERYTRSVQFEDSHKLYTAIML
jgi:site-specific recombinase XerD